MSFMEDIGHFVKHFGLEKHETLVIIIFIFLCLISLIILLKILSKTDQYDIYKFYKHSSNDLYSETDRIKKMLKDLNKITNELNHMISYTHASIEARKQIIESLQTKINTMASEENNLNKKIETLNALNQEQVITSDIINDFLKKNNKHSFLLNSAVSFILGFIFCILGFILSKIFS